eukprot:Em0014g186a
MKVSHEPNFEVLGAPIGDPIFCAKFLAQRRAKAAKLLSQLVTVGSLDPQVALLLLHQCAGYCKLVHLARSTPPSLISDCLALSDADIRHCFSECTGIDTADNDWLQVQLSLGRGGLGLHSLAPHSPAASLIKAGSLILSDYYALESINIFNDIVPPVYTISGYLLLHSTLSQKDLSARLENYQFEQLLFQSSPANRARLLSVSSHHAASWLSVIPSVGLNLHLEPDEFQTALKWWLGIDTSLGSCCPHCPDHQLDPLGHHAVTCKGGGDVVLRPNSLRDAFSQFCHQAHLGGQLEIGCGLGVNKRHSRPADILVQNWIIGKPAAFDFTVTSPLNLTTLTEAGVTRGSAAMAAEVRKHGANDLKCSELGWISIPLAVETYGCWGAEAQSTISRLASRLAIQLQCSKSKAITTIYQRLNITLIRANARALLSRSGFFRSEGGL